MPTFKLDGRDIPFEPGDTIIRAAWRHGVEIPHYCWHPGLSIAANCRMCLVEVKAERPMLMPTLKWDEKLNEFVPANKPKLAPACQTPAVEGQEVFAKSPEASTAQGHVQEFLLLNHPVDCPICDQAGECKLQDYWLENQGTAKRKRTEPVHKPKAVRFGETIVYDAERCVMCTRCIRFCDEVAHDHVLDMRERGNKNEITVSPGRQLDGKYTLMTEHVCPVGALTSKDFRFKARVWFLRAQKSICSGCATGCNDYMDYDPRQNKVYRIRPRDNEAVNKFWMCDDGMLSYRRVHENRVLHGSVRNGQQTAVAPEEALRLAGAALSNVPAAKLALVLSAQHSSEDNDVLARFGRELGSSRFYLAALGGWDADDILRDADNNPNRAGALAAVDGKAGSIADLLKDIASGDVQGVLALGWATAEDAAKLAPLRSLKTVVTLSSNTGPLTELASVLVPVASFAEMDGTFVNAKGMAQRFSRVIHPPAGIRPAWEALVQIARALNKPLAVNQIGDVRNTLLPDAAPEAQS
ncbi:MAG TPA: 2Fe-2S iron-sulfur cluster-binding protein [Polyangiales bacterium]|nr:2Fe-2S iron-sulfur cluster-binding protein [Polyangiales bacterium]